MNKVFLVGRLGADPELAYTGKGLAITTLSLATRDPSKAWDKKTEWHRVVVFGKLAEAAATHLIKGQEVCVEGKLHSNTWKTEDGKNRKRVEIIASSIEFLSGGKINLPDNPDNEKEEGGGNDPPF